MLCLKEGRDSGGSPKNISELAIARFSPLNDSRVEGCFVFSEFGG